MSMTDENGDDGSIHDFWGLSEEEIKALEVFDTAPPEPPDSRRE